MYKLDFKYLMNIFGILFCINGVIAILLGKHNESLLKAELIVFCVFFGLILIFYINRIGYFIKGKDVLKNIQNYYKLWLEKIGKVLIVIFLMSFFLTFAFPDIGFNKSTFFWFSSTIAQTFGALLAIIVTMSLARMSNLYEWMSNIDDEKMDKLVIVDRKKKNILRSIEEPLIFFALLILISITFIMLIDSYSYVQIIFAFWVLFFLTVYCIMILMIKIINEFT